MRTCSLSLFAFDLATKHLRKTLKGPFVARTCYGIRSSSNCMILEEQANKHTANAVPVVHHPAYSAPQLPAGHRFPMGVFQKIYDTLLQDQIISEHQVHVPSVMPSRELLHLVHDEQYVDSFCAGRLDDKRTRRIGFGDMTSQPVLIHRTKAEVAGTLLTALLALEYGLAVNTAGGTHHAFPDYGSGFCILNDLAVTARYLLSSGRAARVMILDLDVHQGDGTAFIFRDDPQVHTISFHAASNFPAVKQQSDVDAALPDGTGDDQFLRTLADVLPHALSSFRPNIVLYDAGIDTHADDALGRMQMTDEGLRRRELQVLDTCLGSGVPVAGVVGGGYHKDLQVLARRHCFLHMAAVKMWADYEL